jgi:ATP-binding cassette subfamily B protein
LLDEPTSALDRASARALEKHLPHVLAGRTTILITHTLSLARQADRILVLQDGDVPSRFSSKGRERR